jgi:hypothetical protein
MFEQNQESKNKITSTRKISFEEIWNMDIDSLFSEFDLQLPTETQKQEEDFLSDENWLIF